MNENKRRLVHSFDWSSRNGLIVLGVIGLVVGVLVVGGLGYWWAGRLSPDEAQFTIGVLCSLLAALTVIAIIAVRAGVQVLISMFLTGHEKAVEAGTKVADVRDMRALRHRINVYPQGQAANPPIVSLTQPALPAPRPRILDASDQDE
jgi:hypothetical protein